MIVVVFQSRAAFDAFRATMPDTEETPFTRIGQPAFEFYDADGNGSGRVFVAHGFTAAEAQSLKDAGADVRIGSADGPAWPGDQSP